MKIWDVEGLPGHKIIAVDTRRREQVRFPRSKKRRIRDKLAKRPENFTVVSEQESFLFDYAGVMGEILKSLYVPGHLLAEPEPPSWRQQMRFTAMSTVRASELFNVGGA